MPVTIGDFCSAERGVIEPETRSSQMMGASSPIESTHNFGKYTLIEKLGESYLGFVYRGFDQDLGRPVVIRILCDGIKWDSKLEETLNSQCHAIADLKHPNIATIFEFGREGQNRYIAMESLGGGTLRNLIAQNPVISVERKLSIIIQVAEGLSHAHKKGILHRDLEPGKIHLTADGKAKIRDFAIAHVLMNYLPHPALRWGVPIYLCPEQIQHKDCDERSDLFSAGTIFYELLTHVHPFHDRDSNKALDNILSDNPIPTFEKFPDVPAGLWTVLKSCLAKNPEERYGSVDELSTACKDLLKSLAEDTQLMLAELYASLPHLRKAAAQPGASEGTVTLLQKIQNLLQGDSEGDYTSLDQLMTILMEQYPAIEMAADVLPTLDSICPQLPPEEAADNLSAFGFVFAEEISEPQATVPEAPAHTIAEPCMPEEFPDPGMKTESAEPPESAEKSVLPETTEIKTADPSVEPPAAQAIPGENPIPVEALPIIPAGPSPLGEKSINFLVPGCTSRPRRIPRLSYRSAAALLSILVIATAGYIVQRTGVASSIREAWHHIPYTDRILQAVTPQSHKRGGAEARSAQENAHRTQEANSSHEPAIPGLKEAEQYDPSSMHRATSTERLPEESASLISEHINSGKLQLAKAEMEHLEQSYPDAPQLPGLHKLWQAANLKQSLEQPHKEEEQKPTSKQREDDWNRQLAEFLGHGKYNEAAGAVTTWLSENPGSLRAQELNARIQEIQRHLKTYASSLAESRYSDALSAISSAEKLNPADSNFAELRRQAEARKSAAHALLTVRRLGAKAVLLLDGHPIGKDGEMENESVSIGSHTLAIENEGGLIASRSQEFVEGQHLAFAYDPVKQSLHTMTDVDRDLLAQRKAMEETEHFSLEHDHGFFRGSCRGVLSLDSLDVAYSPTSGEHGFRIPFKLLKLKTDGKSVSMYYISDNTHFQTFRFQDSQSADKFRQKWDELKEFLRR